MTTAASGMTDDTGDTGSDAGGASDDASAGQAVWTIEITKMADGSFVVNKEAPGEGSAEDASQDASQDAAEGQSYPSLEKACAAAYQLGGEGSGADDQSSFDSGYGSGAVAGGAGGKTKPASGAEPITYRD